ncbi:MAG: hypothetical protein BGN88_09440 [Clostridiales bacterium 43-6]|nr:MAG: hypothetical protein BGN88_09440 [Clostridiales bacterium 43-6]
MSTEIGIGIPKNIKIRDYQGEAIRAWLSHEGCGILEMATGTGKTITSICGIVKLLEQYALADTPCGLVLVLPYKVLLEQWVDVLSDFGIHPLVCYESKAIWKSKLTSIVDLFNKGHRKSLFIATTNATFYTDDFQEELERISGDYIFCIDEMHHFATKSGVDLLPEKARFRLGLSATLMSKWSSENMDKLKAYFKNDIVYSFSLERAIKEGFLTPYYYHPVFVELTVEEKDEYYILSKKIGKAIASNDDITDNEVLQSLLLKRARIITTAKNKYEMLKMMKNIIVGTKYNLFYCGDRIEADERYVEKINKLLSFDFGIKSHTFTAAEDKKDRKYVLNTFAKGDIDAITAIRCLDEGVDIPQLRRAFILSSGTNPKEFIQRRGRILRKSEGKDMAEIYDFFVVPTLNQYEIKNMSSEEISAERRILNREFDRFKEFADLSLNKEEAYSKIISIWNMYNN